VGVGDKGLRALEAGTKIGYLALFGVAAWLIWRAFSKKGVVRIETPPDVGPVDSGAPPPPPEASGSDTGISSGGLSRGVHARILEPARDTRVYRNLLSSYFDAVIEVTNEFGEAKVVQIDVVGDFYELTGGSRLGIRTVFGPYTVSAGRVERFNVQIDSGNKNTGLYELGQANAILTTYVNNIQTSETSAEVW
jgi:hypothetical protein